MRPPRPVIRVLGRVHSALLRASGGRLAGRVGRARILLLTTTGRRSGRARTVPLLYVTHDDAYVVVGSQGGHDTHPGWVLNLRASPTATVRVGRDDVPVRAEEASDALRPRLWERLEEVYPRYADYRARTSRVIPILLLRSHR